MVGSEGANIGREEKVGKWEKKWKMGGGGGGLCERDGLNRRRNICGCSERDKENGVRDSKVELNVPE